MPRILLLAATTGYQVRSFQDAARRLGIEAILATDRCHILDNPWGDRAIPIRFDEEVESAAHLAEALRNTPVDGIVAVADRPTLIAALTADRLGVPWHPPEAARVCRDKRAMKVLFETAGLLVPRHRCVPADAVPLEIAGLIAFPCVLKPLGLSGSRGVIRADDLPGFIEAFERIRRLRVTPRVDYIQIETYIPGREFALEGLMNRGCLQTLAIFDKPDPLEGPFFEESIYVTPSREPAATQQAVVETTQRAARALGLWHGPVHAEMRVNDTGVYMLEIAARPIGGLCARALRFLQHGRTPPAISLEDLVILHAIGAMPAELFPATPASGVMMIPVPRAGVLQSVSGLEEARAIPGVDDVVVTAKPGEKLVPLPEGASYTGFIFATGAGPLIVEEALRQSHRALRFDILSALAVLRDGAVE